MLFNLNKVEYSKKIKSKASHGSCLPLSVLYILSGLSIIGFSLSFIAYVATFFLPTLGIVSIVSPFLFAAVITVLFIAILPTGLMAVAAVCKFWKALLKNTVEFPDETPVRIVILTLICFGFTFLNAIVAAVIHLITDFEITTPELGNHPVREFFFHTRHYVPALNDFLILISSYHANIYAFFMLGTITWAIMTFYAFCMGCFIAGIRMNK